MLPKIPNVRKLAVTIQFQFVASNAGPLVSFFICQISGNFFFSFFEKNDEIFDKINASNFKCTLLG